MERIVIKNRFRVVDSNTKQTIFLNTVTDVNGIQRFVNSFDKYEEAKSAAKMYALMCNQPISRYVIQPFAAQGRHVIKALSPEASQLVKERKMLSGEGLKYNTFTPPRQENKYNSDGWYGRETYMYQSTERNKGLSLIHKMKDKKGSNTGEDHATQHALNKLVNDGTLSLSSGIVTSLKKKKWANRLEIKTHLKGLGYTCRQIDRILHQYYN